MAHPLGGPPHRCQPDPRLPNPTTPGDLPITEGGRRHFATADRSAALWPSERAERIRVGSLSDAFAAAREGAGLPKELGLHCLRHSYVTHLIEAGYDPAFVQTQVGHAYASVTGLYTSVGDDFKQKTIQRMIASRLDGRGRKQDGDADG